jgi:hypothetical protein
MRPTARTAEANQDAQVAAPEGTTAISQGQSSVPPSAISLAATRKAAANATVPRALADLIAPETVERLAMANGKDSIPNATRQENSKEAVLRFRSARKGQSMNLQIKAADKVWLCRRDKVTSAAASGDASAKLKQVGDLVFEPLLVRSVVDNLCCVTAIAAAAAADAPVGHYCLGKVACKAPDCHLFAAIPHRATVFEVGKPAPEDTTPPQPEKADVRPARRSMAPAKPTPPKPPAPPPAGKRATAKLQANLDAAKAQNKKAAAKHAAKAAAAARAAELKTISEAAADDRIAKLQQRVEDLEKRNEALERNNKELTTAVVGRLPAMMVTCCFR